MKILFFLHQLPQNLVGLLVILFSRAKFNGKYYWTKYNFGVSLGSYIIMNTPNELKHEQGHQRQSLYLGWLYLLVIGIPSALGNLWDKIAHRHWTWHQRYWWYYHQPWESWADKLGGVNRF